MSDICDANEIGAHACTCRKCLMYQVEELRLLWHGAREEGYRAGVEAAVECIYKRTPDTRWSTDLLHAIRALALPVEPVASAMDEAERLRAALREIRDTTAAECLDPTGRCATGDSPDRGSWCSWCVADAALHPGNVASAAPALLPCGTAPLTVESLYASYKGDGAAPVVAAVGALLSAMTVSATTEVPNRNVDSAAPASGGCGAADHPVFVYPCTLPKGHTGPHDNGSGDPWFSEARP